MTTLPTLLAEISAKPGWIRTQLNAQKSYGSDREISYNIYWKNQANVVCTAFVKIYVTNYGLPNESAEPIGSLPTLGETSGDSAFKQAVDAKIVQVKNGNAKIKRIVMEQFDEANTFCIVAVYQVDNATTPTQVSKSQYFAHFDNSVLKFYPYVG